MSVTRSSIDPAAAARDAVARAPAGDPARLVEILRHLQDLSASAQGDFEEQIADVLALGCRELDLEVGVLIRLRETEATVVHVIAPDGSIETGSTFPVSQTYCGAVLDSLVPLGFPDDERPSSTGWPTAPVLPLEAYLGMPVRLGTKLYGVLSFGSRETRAESFGREEKQVVEVLAKHLEAVVGAWERQQQVVTALNEISNAPPAEFFLQVARAASELLEMEYVVVCERTDTQRLRTRACLARGEVMATYEYDAAGTPCERSMEEGSYYCADGVQEAFPADRDLVTMGARSYIGSAIEDGNGNVIGVISALGTRPQRRSRRKERLMRILASRATAGCARVRAERELSEQRELFELASTAVGIGIWDMDLTERTLVLDPNAREILGVEDDGNVFEAWCDAIHPADRDDVRETVGAHLRGETDAFLVEHRIVRKDGTTRWVLVQGHATRDEQGKATRTISAGLDITPQKQLDQERQRLESKVQQAQRLESLGVLAGGLAHDFNNLLMGVLGNAGLARRAVQAGSLVDQKIAEIETAAQRAAELTNQMLAYSGRARFTADSFDLNSLVEEMARLLRTVVSKKAALSLQLGSEPLPIEADAGQVRQVVMNLITNASDALADQPGAVTMASGMRHFDRHFLSDVVPDEDLIEGTYAYLEVADTGVGMDDDTRSRIFDPFFTTKFTGRGLGLAAVLGIMRSHGGGIRVQSAPGEGTRATVIFPPADADQDMLEEDPGVDDDSWEGQGAVLVVDDEEMVRNLMATVLEDAGFEVLTASDGVEALEVFEANADSIRLILLDMMMPRMNGEEVYTEIRAKRPDTSIILMSGFSEEQVTRGIPEDDARFLKKPFQIGALLDTVQKVLDS